VYQWLAKAIADRPSQSAEIQSVLDEVNLAISEAGNKPPRGHGVQWWHPFFRWPAQLYAGQLPADERAALVAQYRPFEEPVEDSAILDPDYVGPLALAGTNRPLQILFRWTTPAPSPLSARLPVGR
jgi:hypothetical protein